MNNRKPNITVSDILADKISTWENLEIDERNIFIEAGVGQGKSYFIKT